MTPSRSTDVVIVGGGPIGLTASLCLSHLGVDHVLLERRRGTSVYPRAIGINQRSMELFRTLGAEALIDAHAAPRRATEATAWYTSFDGPTPLHGRMLGSRNSWGGGVYRAEYAAASPATWRILAQSRLEPSLLAAAERSPRADIRFNSEVQELKQDESSVTVHCEEAGTPFAVQARFLIGADGGRTVPTALGIDFSGPTNLVDMVSIHFTADLTSYHDPTILMSWFVNPDLGGSVDTGFLYPVGPWDDIGHSEEFVFVFARGADEPTGFDEAAALERLRLTLGINDLRPKVHHVSHWFIQAVVADKYRSGRCFLAGDAAHRVPPWGALGMNTGLGDVQNLSWKLAVALRVEQFIGLLDTYEEERRPIAQAVASGALNSFKDAVGLVDTALGLDPTGPPSDGWSNIDQLLNGPAEENPRRQAMQEALNALDTEFHAHGEDCGFFYERGAIQPLEKDAPRLSHDPLVYTPRTLPGHHLPHFWLDESGAGRSGLSTVELPALTHFVLIVDEGADTWRQHLAQLDHPLGDMVTVATISGDAKSSDHAVMWEVLREVGPSGAILVRPDGIVAWRWAGMPTEPGREIAEALRSITRTS